MKFFQKAEQILEWVSIPRLTFILTAGSAACFILGSFNPEFLSSLAFTPYLVLKGEWWRLFTFLWYPLDTHPIFAFFCYYFFYIMGTALEAEWGQARFTHYVLLGAAATIASAFLFPLSAATNVFIATSVFLAFAFLYPDFVVYVFFVIPVKIKYLAVATWIFCIFTFVYGDWAARMALLASCANFFLFFYRPVWQRVKAGRYDMEFHGKRIKERATPFHMCKTCGMTEHKDPKAEFRVCGTCKEEYCANHLKAHEHLAVAATI